MEVRKTQLISEYTKKYTSLDTDNLNTKLQKYNLLISNAPDAEFDVGIFSRVSTKTQQKKNYTTEYLLIKRTAIQNALITSLEENPSKPITTHTLTIEHKTSHLSSGLNFIRSSIGTAFNWTTSWNGILAFAAGSFFIRNFSTSIQDILTIITIALIVLRIASINQATRIIASGLIGVGLGVWGTMSGMIVILSNPDHPLHKEICS